MGFTHVSKVGRGSCTCRSASTAPHSDLASGSGCMLLFQTGTLSASSPPVLVSRAMLVRLVLWIGLLAFLGRPGRPGVLQLPGPFAAVPLVPVDGVVDVIPFALDPRPELTCQEVDLVLCFLWRVQVRSDSCFPSIQLLAMRFRQFGSDAGGTVIAGLGRLVPQGLGGARSVRGWLRRQVRAG